MLISAIVAVAENGVIGQDNQLPWYLPADLAYFKRTTLGHCVIMGRNSFRSIGRPLPKRTNIVLTRDPFFAADGVLTAHSIEEAFQLAEATGDTEAFIIGGGDLYRQTMPLWDKLYLTEVHIRPDGDVFFPPIRLDDWREVWREAHLADDKNLYGYVFRILERVREGGAELS